MQRPLRSRLSDVVTPADRRLLLVFLGIVLVSVALRLLTWDVVADGMQARFVKVTIFAAVSSAVVWLLVRLQTAPGSWIPLVSGLVVLLVGDAIHYTRVLNPISRGGPVRAVSASFGDEASVRRAWDVEVAGQGRARFEGGAVVLESPPGGPAFLRARIENPPDATSQWWLPVGVAERPKVETLVWRASISRTHPFYVVLDVPTLLIQAVSYGVHITYPDEGGVLRGTEVQQSAATDGQMHEWQVVRNSQQITLSLDGEQIWSAPQRGELNQMRLGETKTDSQHGGTMRVESAAYTVTLER